MTGMESSIALEREGKWLVCDLAKLEARLTQAGGVLLHPRVLERNLRFDTPNRSLLREFKVLRLRMDERARLTYKGSPSSDERISQRAEIEFTVSDFEAARQMLELLGYEVIFIYEKYRREYQFMGCLVMLDELPFGNFVEIEGSSAQTIGRAADSLALRWEAMTAMSYHVLFERYRTNSGLAINNLTFADFGTSAEKAEWLGLSYGDEEE